jgi:hypothetical protein
MIDLKKIRLNEEGSNVTPFLRKCFYQKISKWQKVSYQEKKIEKSANLSKCTALFKESRNLIG